ncbi:MAG TPA: hypothetical protein VLA66_00060, partial [Thermoanaerobaculia bacterium]|nr:hypothetical protein [Thermoanaerobaculia bacterium]
ARSGARWLVAAVAIAWLVDGSVAAGSAARVAPWQGLSSFASIGPGVIAPTEVASPWPLRVDGWLLPPWRGRGDVGSFGAFREQYTPAVQTLIRSGQSAALSIALAADRGSSLQRLPALPYARLVPDAGGGPIGLPFERRNGTIVVRAGGLSGTLEVAEQAFPGWRVVRAGACEEVGPGPRGLRTARVSPADATIRFVYRRWRPERVAGWALSLMTAVVLAATARRSLVSRACGR